MNAFAFGLGIIAEGYVRSGPFRFPTFLSFPLSHPFNAFLSDSNSIFPLPFAIPPATGDIVVFLHNFYLPIPARHGIILSGLSGKEHF